MELGLTTEVLCCAVVATRHIHATERTGQLVKVLVDVLWSGSPLVVLCAGGAALKVMQPDNLCHAKTQPPNYQATEKQKKHRKRMKGVNLIQLGVRSSLADIILSKSWHVTFVRFLQEQMMLPPQATQTSCVSAFP